MREYFAFFGLRREPPAIGDEYAAKGIVQFKACDDLGHLTPRLSTDIARNIQQKLPTKYGNLGLTIEVRGPVVGTGAAIIERYPVPLPRPENLLRIRIEDVTFR